MKLKQLISLSKSYLQKSNIEDFNLKIKLLIEYVFDIKKEQIILNYDREIDEDKVLEFNNLLEKVKNGVPVQYIINKQEFMGLNFYVDENVLIPQPDTEILVEEVIKYCNIIRNVNKTTYEKRENDYEDKKQEKTKEENIKNNLIIEKIKQDNINSKIKILDLCTGSGIIGISIYKYLENVEIYASDISKKALEIANKNAKNNDAKINFINSNMFENIKEKDFDIIVSNPPYIESSVIKELSKEVQNEPRLALDGGEDGLDFYRIILKNASNYLKEDGVLFLEIGYNQKDKLEELFNNSNLYKNIKCVKDLSGNDRVIIIKK